MENCLDKMSEKNISSIAFPAIGTGIFRFPRNKALSNIVRAIISSPKDKIREVYLCGTRDEVVNEFIIELERQLEGVTLTKNGDTHKEIEEGKVLAIIP